MDEMPDSVPMGDEWGETPAWRARVERLGLEFLAEFFAVDTERNPERLESLVELGNLYTQLGEYERGLEIDQRLVTLLPDNPTVLYNLACSLALLGHRDEALDALEQAEECGYDDIAFLRGDDDLASLRGEGRFLELVRRLEARLSE